MEPYDLYCAKCNRMAGFLFGAIELGYSMDDAWDLLQTSEEGQGILSDDYVYCVKYSGRTSVTKADDKLGYKYNKQEDIKLPRLFNVELLAVFIEDTHKHFSVDYKNMFDKYPIGKFFDELGNCLGDYDDKLYRAYLK